MNYFFIESKDVDSLKLPQEEANHCIKVLRKNVGDKIYLLDGCGQLYHVEITSIQSKNCYFKILKIDYSAKRNIFLHLVFCPTKNWDRTQIFIEKAVELGIEAISFVESERTIRKKLNREKIQKIILAACKQSVTLFFPKVFFYSSLKDFFSNQESPAHYYLGFCGEDIHKKPLNSIQFTLTIPNVFLVGPEGDFTDNEVNLAKQHTTHLIDLGEKRLRSETAAIAVIAYFNLRFDLA